MLYPVHAVSSYIPKNLLQTYSQHLKFVWFFTQFIPKNKSFRWREHEKLAPKKDFSSVKIQNNKIKKDFCFHNYLFVFSFEPTTCRDSWVTIYAHVLLVRYPAWNQKKTTHNWSYIIHGSTVEQFCLNFLMIVKGNWVGILGLCQTDLYITKDLNPWYSQLCTPPAVSIDLLLYYNLDQFKEYLFALIDLFTMNFCCCRIQLVGSSFSFIVS